MFLAVCFHFSTTSNNASPHAPAPDSPSTQRQNNKEERIAYYSKSGGNKAASHTQSDMRPYANTGMDTGVPNTQTPPHPGYTSRPSTDNNRQAKENMKKDKQTPNKKEAAELTLNFLINKSAECSWSHVRRRVSASVRSGCHVIKVVMRSVPSASFARLWPRATHELTRAGRAEEKEETDVENVCHTPNKRARHIWQKAERRKKAYCADNQRLLQPAGPQTHLSISIST